MILDRITNIVLVVLGFILLVLLVLGLAVTLQPLQAENEPPPAPTLAPTWPPTDIPAPDLVKVTPGANAGDTPARLPSEVPPQENVLTQEDVPAQDGAAPGSGEAVMAGESAASDTATAVDGATVPVAPDTFGVGGIPPGTTVIHTVSEGEWLIQIARCYGTSYNGILGANRIPVPNLIYPDQVVIVPNAGTQGTITGPPCVVAYSVAPGDTWELLAQRYDTTTVILQRANPGALAVGRSIWVPRLP